MLLAKNKKAYHEYEIIKDFIAGIKLHGYEVKAIREKKVSFDGAYVKIMSGVPYVVGMHIGTYSKQSQDPESTDNTRRRALLLNKKEIETIDAMLNQKGHTGVPLALILRNNMVKLEIGIGKGRKEYEKKVVAKERQIRKDLEKFNKEVRQTKGMPRI